MEIQVFPPQFKCASLTGSSQAQGECWHPELEMPKYPGCWEIPAAGLDFRNNIFKNQSLLLLRFSV